MLASFLSTKSTNNLQMLQLMKLVSMLNLIYSHILDLRSFFIWMDYFVVANALSGDTKQSSRLPQNITCQNQPMPFCMESEQRQELRQVDYSSRSWLYLFQSTMRRLLMARLLLILEIAHRPALFNALLWQKYPKCGVDSVISDFMLYLQLYNLGNAALITSPPIECPINDSWKCSPKLFCMIQCAISIDSFLPISSIDSSTEFQLTVELRMKRFFQQIVFRASQNSLKELEEAPRPWTKTTMWGQLTVSIS